MRLIHFWRNDEIKKVLILYAALGVLLSIFMGWRMGRDGMAAGVFVSLIYILLYLFFTGKRYRQIEELSAQLDAVLHGNQTGILSDCSEGELAILHSELEKLLLRLREQSDQLQNEKELLANALADISHQIKTPLTSIHLLLERFGETEMDMAKRQEMVCEITGFIERIDWLIYALLRISRLDAGAIRFQKRKISVRDLVEKAAEPLAISMDLRGIGWKADIPEEISFQGDPEWSGEAIANILKNCMEYTPENGTIMVMAEENAVYTRIEIRDDGEDIPQEDMPHLFERFYRGRQSSGGGVGIGLSLSQRIIQSQNGTIRVSNHKEGGPVFDIKFYKSIV